MTQEMLVGNIPIVNESGEIVGWTDEVPQIVAGRMRHQMAAALLKAELSTAYIELTSTAAARRAGAPEDWQEPWRCMAICPVGLAARLGAEHPLIGALPIGNRSAEKS